VCLSGVPKYLRTGQGDRITKMFAGFAMWVRDDVVYPTMGKEVGAKFLPYFLTLFFFILFMNLLGLVPGRRDGDRERVRDRRPRACSRCSMMVFGGMIAQGRSRTGRRSCRTCRGAIWPLMFVVELVGIFVKPFALTIRLFANMTGGHMVVLSFMGLLFLVAHGAGRARVRRGHVAARRRLRGVHHDHRGVRRAVAGVRVHDALVCSSRLRIHPEH
jgi:F-type H+-transporting ATPase subunit a